MTRPDSTGVLVQLIKAGVIPNDVEMGVNSISGVLDLAVLEKLRAHPSFQEGIFHGLHPEVGEDRTEFRSFRQAFGVGSLQVVVNQQTGRFHADVDKFSPYEDVVGVVGHLIGEVVPNWVRRVFKRGG